MSGRCGFTTGTCAAAAAKAAALVLCGQPTLAKVNVALPGGECVSLPLFYARRLDADTAEASVRKDAGDDPDVTHGCEIIARIQWAAGSDVAFAAGDGVGTVTKPGLAVPPGEPAINPGPRAIIRHAVREVTSRGVLITISIPGGQELARKTYNPRLGVAGGLSILGTTGRVRPFSHPALRESLKCCLAVSAACGITKPVFVPGHIGERAARARFMLQPEQVIEVGNEWGWVIDLAARAPLTDVLIVGHPGKLAKLSADEWDTHSSRSQSAVRAVLATATRVFNRALAEQATVEAIFSALTPVEAARVADVVAAEITQAVAQRLAANGSTCRVATLLVNLKGAPLGASGDLTPWQ